jgi:phospholipid-binding lipoprotein MlaA
MRAWVVVCLLLAGCANSSDPAANDPFESVNRQIFAFNHALDKHAALPAASYYKASVPEGVRDGVHNVINNLSLPVTLANDILQGEMTQAGYAVCRLGVNTTVGVLGVMDPATDWGCPQNDEDFGQTLAVYGVPGGPYLVLPLLGPTVPRDAAGRILVDHYFNPLSYLAYNGKFYVSLGVNAVKLIDQRSRGISALSEIERTSIDYYAAVRSIYYQRRGSAIQNDAPLAPEPLTK